MSYDPKHAKKTKVAALVWVLLLLAAATAIAVYAAMHAPTPMSGG